MTTAIRRTWTRRVATIKAAATHCRRYNPATGEMITTDPAHAWEAWASNPRASLLEVRPGAKWTVHVTGNHFYDLTTAPSAPAAEAAAPASPLAAAAPLLTPAPVPAPSAEPSEETVLRLARQYEERHRPTAARLYISPITGTASLRWLRPDGAESPLLHPIALEGRHTSALAEPLAAEAFRHLDKAGFRPVPGSYWTQDGSHTARLSIAPTLGYLDWQDRRYGPEPELPAIDGVTWRREQRGMWIATLDDGRTARLTWQPTLACDMWTLWTGEDYTHLAARSGKSPRKATLPLRHPAHLRTPAAGR